MAKHQFRLRFEAEAVIELDDAVIDAVTDEWRSMFYQLHSPEQIARHVGYNLVINNAGLDQLEGWADQPESNARIVQQPDWEVREFNV